MVSLGRRKITISGGPSCFGCGTFTLVKVAATAMSLGIGFCNHRSGHICLALGTEKTLFTSSILFSAQHPTRAAFTSSSPAENLAVLSRRAIRLSYTRAAPGKLGTRSRQLRSLRFYGDPSAIAGRIVGIVERIYTKLNIVDCRGSLLLAILGHAD